MRSTLTLQNQYPAGQFSVREFCDWSGLCKTKVYELIKQGHLTARKCGRRTFIAVEEALRWRDALPTM